jgi:heme a synthase
VGSVDLSASLDPADKPREDESSGREDESSGREDESSGREDESSGREDESSGREDESSRWEDESSRWEDESRVGHYLPFNLIGVLVKLLRNIILLTTVLALGVVMLGAYTRLTHAGLGCPDWPFCYGLAVVPNDQINLQLAQQNYPDVLLETDKAWTEMAHRYFAGAVLLFTLLIVAMLVYYRKFRDHIFLVGVLCALLLFQPLLGMWTVTLKLLPIVVMGHLLGGIGIFCILGLLFMRVRSTRRDILPQYKPWLLLGMVLIFFQIALGGWVSSNYAGIACIGFPQCNGKLLPEFDFKAAFNIFSNIGFNYQGGLLQGAARATIQWVHRVFAVIVTLYILCLSISLLRQSLTMPIKKAIVMLLCCLVVQWCLGLVNVMYLLPLWAAVLHNGVAAVLLLMFLRLRDLCIRNVHVS